MGTTCIPATLLRQRAGDLLARVRYARERFVTERYGEAVAALVSVDDLHRLEAADRLSAAQRTQRQEALSQDQAVREAILAHRSGAPLPESTDEVRRLREERADALAGCVDINIALKLVLPEVESTKAQVLWAHWVATAR